MADDWNFSTPTKADIAKAEKIVQEKVVDNDSIRSYFTKYTDANKICMLLYGKDGTGKSAIPLAYLKLLKPEEKMVVIDLDGGNIPIIQNYYPDQTDRIFHLQPIVLNNTDIDYIATFEKIRNVIYWVKNNYEQENIKAIVFDGLSTALSYAEQQMRIEKHLQVDGGVNMAFWKIRNKYFIEMLEQIKSIPIARFYIAHEDFIISNDEKSSAVKDKTNQMMFQKILCEKQNNFESTDFLATVHKSKFDVRQEGKKLQFISVQKKTGDFDFSGEEVIKQFI